MLSPKFFAYTFLVNMAILTSGQASLTNDEDDQTHRQEQRRNIIRKRSHLSQNTTEHLLNTAEQYLYNESYPHLYNPNVVNTAALKNDADALVAKGVMLERGVWPYEEKKTAFDYYLEASKKGSLWGLKRMYFIFKNGELGQTKNLDTAMSYAANYQLGANSKIEEESFTPLRLEDLSAPKKIIDGLQNSGGSQLHFNSSSLNTVSSPRKKSLPPVSGVPTTPRLVFDELKAKIEKPENQTQDSSSKKQKCSIL